MRLPDASGTPTLRTRERIDAPLLEQYPEQRLATPAPRTTEKGNKLNLREDEFKLQGIKPIAPLPAISPGLDGIPSLSALQRELSQTMKSIAADFSAAMQGFKAMQQPIRGLGDSPQMRQSDEAFRRQLKIEPMTLNASTEVYQKLRDASRSPVGVAQASSGYASFSSKGIEQKIDKLHGAIVALARSPQNLYISSPEPVSDAADFYSQLTYNNTVSSGLG